MQRFVFAAAALTVMGTTVIAASAANFAPLPAGTPVYGALAGAPPAGEAPPSDAPAGYHYVWVYSYDHHGYRAHWEAQRNS